MLDLEFVRQAISWLESVKGRPFFLYLSTAAPHRPCVPPEFAQGRSEAGSRGDSVFLVDWMVGQVIETLGRLRLAENTLLIFTSDNGAVTLYPEDGHPMHRPNGQWRGQKADIWEGGHRVPFVVRWPGRIGASRVVDDLICLTDVLPTVAAATNSSLPIGSAEDGEDVMTIMTGGVRSEEWISKADPPERQRVVRDAQRAS